MVSGLANLSSRGNFLKPFRRSHYADNYVVTMTDLIIVSRLKRLVFITVASL